MVEVGWNKVYPFKEMVLSIVIPHVSAKQ